MHFSRSFFTFFFSIFIFLLYINVIPTNTWNDFLLFLKLSPNFLFSILHTFLFFSSLLFFYHPLFVHFFRLQIFELLHFFYSFSLPTSLYTYIFFLFFLTLVILIIFMFILNSFFSRYLYNFVIILSTSFSFLINSTRLSP